jgi:hypothetical protein
MGHAFWHLKVSPLAPHDFHKILLTCQILYALH